MTSEILCLLREKLTATSAIKATITAAAMKYPERPSARTSTTVAIGSSSRHLLLSEEAVERRIRSEGSRFGVIFRS